MNKKEIKVIPPEGYVIDKENSTFECIKFKKITQLPNKWEDLNEMQGWYINNKSDIIDCNAKPSTINDKNIYPTKKLAEAGLALTQLLYLREIYNDGWVVDWSDNSTKYCIIVYENEYIMHFKTKELRALFLENFRDLLEIAKPLL